jgi:VIT1/CCC1 family predicted Fe2+/Mn2+ transporter
LTGIQPNDSFSNGEKLMIYRRLAAVAVPILVFLLWLIVGRATTASSIVAGAAVAVAVAAWAPVIDF